MRAIDCSLLRMCASKYMPERPQAAQAEICEYWSKRACACKYHMYAGPCHCKACTLKPLKSVQPPADACPMGRALAPLPMRTDMSLGPPLWHFHNIRFHCARTRHATRSTHVGRSPPSLLRGPRARGPNRAPQTTPGFRCPRAARKLPPTANGMPGRKGGDGARRPPTPQSAPVARRPQDMVLRPTAEPQSRARGRFRGLPGPPDEGSLTRQPRPRRGLSKRPPRPHLGDGATLRAADV